MTVVLLAGGRASRFPGKLERSESGDPLIVRAYERFAPFFPTVISAAATFPPEIDARLHCPIIVDRWPQRGPLAGLLSALDAVATPYVIAIAADLPFVEAGLVRDLIAGHQDGDEAVIPEHDGKVEPLCALYARDALLREGPISLRDSNGAVRAMLSRMNARRMPMSPQIFLNINTRDDWDRAFVRKEPLVQ